MKLTDLEIGQFATRKWYDSNTSLCVKRYSSKTYEYLEDGKFSLVAKKDSSIFDYNDFELCDRNGKLIEKLTYP